MLAAVRFRTKALAKRRQAEELDRLPEVAKPRGWLAALALAVLVAGVVVFLLAGSIPRRVTGDGVLASAGGVAEIQSPRAGEVTRVLVAPGDEVGPSTAVVTLRGPDGATTEVAAGQAGTVLGVRTGPGRVLQPGGAVVTIARRPGDEPTRAYLFLDQEDAAGVAPGMEVDVHVASAPSEVFGSVVGHVESVGDAPVSPEEMDVLLANRGLVEQFSRNGPPILATVALHRGDTPSGLAWTSGAGPDFPLRVGTLVDADVQQGEQSVLDVVIGDR